MQTTNIHTKNYTEFREVYQLKLPLELDGLIPEDDSVRLLGQILEELDYTKLYQAYSAKGRNPAVDPKTMFKILVYAYSQNIYSTHKIEKACKRDINFMWLLAGAKVPDHSTIARFRQKHSSDAVENLFYQLVNILYEMNEIEYENVFIDGTKIEANANKYSFVWKKCVVKNQSRMHEKISTFIHNINLEYCTSYSFDSSSAINDIRKVSEFLEEKCVEEKIQFVKGCGTRPKPLQKQYEVIKGFEERQKAYEVCNEKFGGRNSFSKTDTDATFMHMKEDHMRNSQLKPGYNLQIGVEAEYITGVGVFSERNDLGTLKPMLENMTNSSGHKYNNVIADSGYESEEAYVYLEENEYKAYIKPQTYEKWKKRSFKNDISKRENMEYDKEKDEYTCHNGKKLRFIYSSIKTSGTGYKADVSFYECESCEGCSHKNKCTKAAGNRRIQVSKLFTEKRETSYKNIMSPKGVHLRVNRSIQVEGAFGVLKSDYKFKRFLTRGKTSVKTEFLFLCIGYNINKLHSKIQNDRLGMYLHPLKSIA